MAEIFGEAYERDGCIRMRVSERIMEYDRKTKQPYGYVRFVLNGKEYCMAYDGDGWARVDC